jgi:hypothetical protein
LRILSGLGRRHEDLRKLPFFFVITIQTLSSRSIISLDKNKKKNEKKTR